LQRRGVDDRPSAGISQRLARESLPAKSARIAGRQREIAGLAPTPKRLNAVIAA